VTRGQLETGVGQLTDGVQAWAMACTSSSKLPADRQLDEFVAGGVAGPGRRARA
jgi:hypothetical protein